MPILSTSEFRSNLKEKIESSNSKIQIYCAYIKEPALENLLENISDINVSVVCRWQKRDLITNASDLSVYHLCKKKNWKFGILNSLHGKLYVTDDSTIYIGSANVTSRGLGLINDMNLEYGVEVPAETVDLKKIQNLNQEVTWVNDDLFSWISTEIKASTKEDEINWSWSSAIRERLQTSYGKLWSVDIPRCMPQKLRRPNFDDADVLNDFVLLNLEISETNDQELANAFKKLKIYEVFSDWIETYEDINFGRLTKLIHDSLLDDPTPFRSDIKERLTNRFFDWISLLTEEYEIIQHRVTKSIRKRQDI